jgi:hypothetical protein
MSQSTNSDESTTTSQQYNPFDIEKMIDPIEAVSKIDETKSWAATRQTKGESAERLAAIISLLFLHDVTQHTQSAQGAPKSFGLHESLLLPDFRLDDSKLVEVKFRGSPYTVYPDDSPDIDSQMETIYVKKYRMDEYIKRANKHDVPIYLLIYESENQNILIAKVRELQGSEVATTTFDSNDGDGDDEMYCYDYDAFDHASPFVESISMNDSSE